MDLLRPSLSPPRHYSALPPAAGHSRFTITYVYVVMCLLTEQECWGQFRKQRKDRAKQKCKNVQHATSSGTNLKLQQKSRSKMRQKNKETNKVQPELALTSSCNINQDVRKQQNIKRCDLTESATAR